MSRSQALRQGLPFGAVMATAGASILAGRCGLPRLAVPLLAIAVLDAVWVTVAGVFRHRAEFALGLRAWWTAGPAHEHSGIHTVPLGLAVIISGLAALTARGGGPWLLRVAGAGLALTWLLTLACVGRFVWAVWRREWVLRQLDGTWFLVPAALLGAAIATDAVAAQAVDPATFWLAMLAIFAALTGWLGYWAVAWAAIVRVHRFGLGAVPQAPWWIAMGCAGLAAAALGAVVQEPGSGRSLRVFLMGAAAVTDGVALALCVPVLAASAIFLLRRCRYRASAPWPPTFSTAVLAFGCFAVADLLRSPVFRWFGLGAGYATLVFWAVTALWNTWRVSTGWSHRRGAPGE